MKKIVTILLFLVSSSWATYIPVNGSSVTVYSPNNNTTAIPVSGSFSATGSSVTIYSPNNNTTAIPVSGSFSATGSSVTIYSPNNNTTAIPVSGSFSATGSTVTVYPTNGSTFPVSVATPYTVILTTSGANSSTAAVVNAVGTTLAISGNLTGNQNVSVAAALPGGTNNIGTVTGSTVTVYPTNGATFPVSVATPFTVIQTTVGANSSTEAVVNAVGTTLAISGNLTGNQNVAVAAALPGGTNNIGTVTGSTVTVYPTNGANFPITGNLTGNQAINLVQVGGNSVVTGTGASGNGIPRVTISNDSSLAGSQSVNLVSVGTAAVVTGTGASGTGIPRVTISNDSSLAANQSVNVAQFGGTNVTNDGTSGVPAVGGHKADNGGAAGTDRLTTMPSIYQTDYLNGTAATQGRNGAVSQGTDGLLWVAPLPAMRPASYSASTNTITVAATATDIAAVCGNATNTVLVYAVRASCTETTAGIIPITILKRSTAYSGAWSTMTMVSQDSNYTTAISSAIWFTSNPTVGTIIGALDNYKMGCLATGTASPNDIYISPSDWRMKPIVLRGAGQCLAINLESTTVTGGAFTATFEWIENKTITP